MDRRRFLRAGIISAGGAAALPAISTVAAAQPADTSPYGSLDGIEPDENGVILPEGFTSRIVAVAGDPVGGTDYEWPLFPDGAATFDDGEGGWFHAVNSEVFVEGQGGVSAIHYDADGEIVDAYSILAGTIANCAGGPTPWGTWLSCEEDFFSDRGQVFECDPTGENEAIPRPAMGFWAHEAVAVDPEGEQLYLTEDQPDSRLYRFTPAAYPDLAEGLLEVALVADDGSVTWTEVPDPSAESGPTRLQVAEATVFAGGEGIWYHDGVVYFCTKFDNVVHQLDVRSQTYSVVHRAVPEDVTAGTAVLSGVDNITVDAGTGDLFVAEDGGNMEIVIITPEGEVAPFLRVADQDDSEITGPVFNPTRDRLYFSSQRGPTNRSVRDINAAVESDALAGGVTYEISGPFRGAEAPPETTTTTTEAAETTTTTDAPAESTTTIQSPTTTLAQASEGDGDDDGGSGAALAIGAGVVAVAAIGGAAVALRNRRSGGAPVADAGDNAGADTDDED